MSAEQKPCDVALTPEILAKTGTGLWAIEIEMGAKPRLYVDDVSKKLIGLEVCQSPEETFRFWHERIDQSSSSLISDAAAKMTAGKPAEVQYMWHHPNGQTGTVRANGVRNPAYRSCVRIEGTCQNITDFIHTDIRDSKAAEAVISAFAKENRATYIVNVNDGSFRIYGDVHDINQELAANRQFEGAMHQFAENYIHPLDRTPFLAKFGSVGNLIYLPVGDSTSLEYRCNAVSKEYTWSRVTGQRISEDTILAGFKGCDEEVLRRIVSEKLIGEYDSIYMVDLDLDEIRSAHPLQMDKTGENAEVVKYSGFMRQVAQNASPAYQNDWLQFSNPVYMKEYMAESDHREYVYELSGEKRTMRRFTIDVLERISGAASVLLFSFTDIDDLRAQTLILQNEAANLNEKLARRIAISDYFLHTFDTAYYIDLLTGEIQVLYVDENRQKYNSGSISTAKETLEYYGNNAVHPQDRDNFMKKLDPENIKETLHTSAEFSFLFHDEKAGLDTTFRCTVIRGEDAEHVAIGFKNVTREIEAAEKIKKITRIANRDALTGVGSVSRFMEEKAALNREIEAGTAGEFAIVVCDANNLKVVNDKFGHVKGDAYLKLVCRSICDVFSHSKVFRTGGDEFVILLKSRDYENREKLLSVVRDAPVSAVPGGNVYDTPSFACGMGVYEPGVDRSAEDVYKRADAEMYAHKAVMKERR